MEKDREFEYEALQDAEIIRDFIQSLLKGLEEGRINLSANGDEISLEPSRLFKLSVKARKKGQKSKLSMALSWKDEKKVNIKNSDDIEVSTD